MNYVTGAKLYNLGRESKQTKVVLSLTSYVNLESMPARKHLFMKTGSGKPQRDLATNWSYKLKLQ